jgi:predicted amidophosphoribosyltransferase
MIRTVAFASCYVYSPIGSCEVSERSRVLRALLKAGEDRLIAQYAARVRQQAAATPRLVEFFDSTAVLVPVPGSRPRDPDIMSVTEHLAAALVRERLGGASWAGLRRVRAVGKSGTAMPGARPTVARHYESLAVESIDSADAPRHFVLIDDVVTKGRTLLAAAMRLHEAFPCARIRAFALLRTLGRVPEVHRLLDPCVGEISWRGGDAHRSP